MLFADTVTFAFFDDFIAAPSTRMHYPSCADPRRRRNPRSARYSL